MNVLVTRPGADGKKLCDLLSLEGIQAYHHPLLQIEQGMGFHALKDQLDDYDIIIAVSQHAVFWASQRLALSNQDWPKKIRYFAIGNKTAQSLQQQVQQEVFTPQISDSEHLLNLAELQNVEMKNVLILRGNGGRDLIYQTLLQRGAKVDYCNIYQRVFLPLKDDDFQHWLNLEMTHIVVTSSEQLSYLVQRMPATYDKWFKQLYLFIPSQRIARDAQSLGFLNIINTGSAANPKLRDCISGKSITG